MSYPINYPKPQGANVQIFYKDSDWVKPQGASFVWFTLIGGGGDGNGASIGGGSGAVTNCMVPAFLIPDVLQIKIGSDGISSVISYREKTGAGYNLLTASSGATSSGGSAGTSNYFSCMGFYQSIAGQNGDSGALAASTTTFLSGGSQSGSSVTANYGYSTQTTGNFMMQPVIVGVGALAGNKGGIGCGGGNTGKGGDGLAVIITW